MIPLILASAMVLGQVSPAEAMRISHADLSSFQNSPHYRYLVRPQRWDDARWDKYRSMLVGHLNQLSRSAVPYPLGTEIVSIKNQVLRVNVFKLGFLKAWDRLQDPYFTESGGQVEVYKSWPGGTWPANGKWYPRGSFRYYEEKGRVPSQMLMEGFGDERKVNELMEWSYSKAPMVRADWFHNQTSANDGRDPGYAEFLGFKDEKDFQKIIGFDQKTIQNFRFEVREAVSDTGVALRARAVVRWDGPGGGYWKTLDFTDPKGQRHPLRKIGRQIEDDYDASEQYGTLPNGMWAMGAFDGKGVYQRVVPNNIAGWHSSRSNDKRIHNAIACIECHVNGGLQDIDPYFKSLQQPPLKLNINDLAGTKSSEQRDVEIEQSYKRDVQRAVVLDRQRYESALFEICKLSAKDYSVSHAELWNDYENAKVDGDWAGADFGMSGEEFRKKLLTVARSKIFPVESLIGGLAQDKGKTKKLHIRDWEQIANQTYLIIRGVK